MSTTAKNRKTTRRVDLHRRLAPHMEMTWAEGLCFEKRLLGVKGSHIGAALPEVKPHCAESGQSALLAFGPPVGYARSAGASGTSQRPGPGRAPRDLELRAGVARLAAQDHHRAPGDRQRLPPHGGGPGQVCRLGTSCGCKPSTTFPIGSVLVAFLAGTTTCLLALAFLDQVLWRGPYGWGLAAGAAGTSGGLLWRAILRGRPPGPVDDPITSPFDHGMRTQ